MESLWPSILKHIGDFSCCLCTWPHSSCLEHLCYDPICLANFFIFFSPWFQCHLPREASPDHLNTGGKEPHSSSTWSHRSLCFSVTEHTPAVLNVVMFSSRNEPSPSSTELLSRCHQWVPQNCHRLSAGCPLFPYTQARLFAHPGTN